MMANSWWRKLMPGQWGQYEAIPEPEPEPGLERESRQESDYQKALELGQVLVAYARVMLVGPGGVGKSSLLQGLMNLTLTEAANSTQLADLVTVKPQQSSVPQQLMAKATDDDKPWVRVTDNDEINELVGLVLLVANVASGVTKSSRFRQYLQGAATYAASHLRKFNQNISDDYRQQISSVKNKVVREVFSRAIELAKANPHAQAPESEIMTNVWDCAGQSVYLDILSAFLTPKTIFMLLYDARKDLDDRCIILSHQHGQITQRQVQNMSYLEMLFQWMASIHVTLTDKSSGSIPDYPRIITVGTHGDDPQVRAHKKEIIEKLSQKCECKAFTHLVGKGFIVNNRSAGKGDHEDSTFKKLRKEVHQFTSQSSVTIATPVAWVLFRKVLQKVAKNQPVLTYEEALEVATSCAIPSASFKSVLKFYHDVAVFLYFDHIPSLKGFVFASPQWLVKQLAMVLALEGHEKVHNPALWKLLREKGILVEPLYKGVWKENGLPDEATMDLLEKCCLAAPIDTKREVHPFTGKEYFVASALPLCSDNQLNVSMLQRNVNNACTLHLLFNTRYVPPGYLTRLVTALSKNKKCHISFSHGIYRNQFKLDFAPDEVNSIDEIMITQHIMSVHVNVSRLLQRKSHNLPFSVSCHKIMKTILACSSDIERWLPSIEVTTAFACDKCFSDDHFIKFDPHKTTTQSQLKCEENKICTFNPSQQHWLLPKEAGVDPRDEGVLTETELQYVAEEINRKGKCEELAEALEMTSHLQAHDLLQRWQSDMQQLDIHIKSHLIHYLRCINQTDTAERLRYGQLQPYARKFKEVENLLEKITSFSVSAVTISRLKQKNKTMEELEYQLKRLLPEIDSNLRGKVSQCKKAITEKKGEYEALREKIESMEDQFSKFQLWLKTAEKALEKYKTATNQKQVQQTEDINQDVERHKTNLNQLKVAVQSIIDTVDEPHMQALSSWLDGVTEQYNTLRFNVRSYPVCRWLKHKENQLDSMARLLVFPVHIRKAKEFQRCVNSFSSKMELLSQAAIQEQQKDSFRNYKDQYETLKQKVAEHISTLEQKRWSLYGVATIIGIVTTIMFGVLLGMTAPNSQYWNGLKPEGGLKGSVNYPENFPRMYEHPTLNDLLSLEKQDGEPIRIIERISAQYYELGTYLLNDNHGAVMKTIKENASGKVEAINREILTRWINGQGIEERDWKTLVQALREGPKLNTLADDIVAALDQ